MVEQLIADFAAGYGLPSEIFRYFNAAGADPAGDLGENHTPETHLIPLVLDAMSSRVPYLRIFGDDYPTADGTCIRDYIHVSDLADAHVFNLGNGTVYSVQQVIDTAKAVTSCGLLAHVAPRRPGDPPVLVASAERARRELGWQPRYPELSTILNHACA